MDQKENNYVKIEEIKHHTKRKQLWIFENLCEKKCLYKNLPIMSWESCFRNLFTQNV